MSIVLQHKDHDGNLIPLTVGEVICYLQSMSSDGSSQGQVRLMTGHQSIGLITNELYNPNDPKSNPHKMAMGPWIPLTGNECSPRIDCAQAIPQVSLWIEDLKAHGYDLYSFTI